MIVRRARMTSKGQITIPKAIRDRLGLDEQSEVEFLVTDEGVMLRPTGGFLALYGSVPVPPDHDWTREREKTAEWVGRRAIERAR